MTLLVEKHIKDTKVYCGIDVGGTNLRVGLVDPQGKLLYHFKESTPVESPTALMDKIKELVEKLNFTVAALGVGWPGAVDVNKGLVYETPNISGFSNFPLKKNLESALQMPCFIDNDAKCAGLAEKKFGVAKEFKNFILLTFGTGIGGVIYADDKLIRGRSGLAGEIGHMCLHPKGIPCACGSQGCFERYCSAKSLERKAETEFNKKITAREILELSSKEPWAQKLISLFVEDLSIALGSLTNIFDPEAFIFSGGLFTTGGEPIIETLVNNLQTQGFASLKKDLKILPSSLSGQAGIIGAASLGMNPSQDF